MLKKNLYSGIFVLNVQLHTGEQMARNPKKNKDLDNEEELEELHSKLKRARRYVDDVYDSLADVRYALD